MSDLTRALIEGRREDALAILEKSPYTIDLTSDDKDYKDATALHIAVMQGDLDMAERLIKKGAKLDILAAESRTPLMIAVRNRHSKLVQLLLEKGADPDLGAEGGKTALMEAVSNNDLEIVKNLFKDSKKKIKIEAQELTSYNTAIHIAAIQGSLEIIQKLIENDANIKATNKFKENCLMMAVSKRDDSRDDDFEIIKFFANQGYNTESRNSDGNTALLMAAEKGNLKAVKLLIEKGAKIDAVNDKGMNCLMAAASSGNLEMVKFFLEKGFDPKMSDFLGQTPKTYAIEYGFRDIANLIEEAIKSRKPKDYPKDYDYQLDEFIDNALAIKKYGHLLGLSKNIEIVGPVLDKKAPDKKINVRTEGTFTLNSISELNKELKTYLDHIGPTSSYSSQWKTILEAYENEEKYLNFNGSVTEEDLIKRIDEGVLTTIPCGWNGHDFTIAIKNNYLIVCNRGEGIKEDNKGTHIYELTKDELEILKKPGFIKSLRNRSVSKQEIFSELDKIRKNQIAVLPSKKQFHGTCSFVNAKSLAEGVLFIDKLEELKNAAKATKTASAEEVMSKEELESAIKKAQEDARKEYKKFTGHMRLSDIKQLIEVLEVVKELKDDDSIKHTYQGIAYAYLDQHFRNPEKTEGKKEKRSTELGYALKLLLALDERSRTDFIARLLKQPDVKILELADQYGPKELVDLIIKHSTQESLDLSFKKATDAKKWELAKILYDRGANPNFKNPISGTSLLMTASQWSDVETAKFLLGLDRTEVNQINTKEPEKRQESRVGWTALMYAVYKFDPMYKPVPNIELIKFLLSKGADPTQKSAGGVTALDIAARKPEILAILKDPALRIEQPKVEVAHSAPELSIAAKLAAAQADAKTVAETMQTGISKAAPSIVTVGKEKTRLIETENQEQQSSLTEKNKSKPVF